MSILSAELTVPDAVLLERAIAPDWLGVTETWYEVAPTESQGAESLPKFSYDPAHQEYAVNPSHPQAAALARLVLRGAVDHDKVLRSELDNMLYEGRIDAEERARVAERRQIRGKLVGLVEGVYLTEESVAGVMAQNPRSLFDALDAFTRLPQLSITETELAFVARAELVDFLHGLVLHDIVR